MKKIKHHNKNKKEVINLKESKKFIIFGIVFGIITIAIGIISAYLLVD